MLFRTEVGYLYMSRSYDMARSWTAVRRRRSSHNFLSSPPLGWWHDGGAHTRCASQMGCVCHRRLA